MINLLFAGNSKAFDGMMTTALSITKYSRKPITVYLLTMDLSDENPDYAPITEEQRKFLDGVYKSSNFKSSVVIKDVTELYKESLLGAKNEKTSYTPYSMIRLFLDKIPDMPDKILYLDTDVMLRGDIDELYSIDVTGYELAGVLDYYGRRFIEKDYINSGVLLINLNMIRKTCLFSKALKQCSEKRMLLPDQSAINDNLQYKLILPMRFNEQKKTKQNTLVRHFTKTIKFFPVFRTRNVKPWHIEAMHKKLKINEHDDVLSFYERAKRVYECAYKNKSKTNKEIKMNKYSKEIPIFLSIDDNYLPFLAVAVESIKAHADENVLYNIMILSEEVTELGKEKIASMQSENVRLSFVNVRKKIEPIRVALKQSLRDYYTEAIFYRMFIASLFPNLKKAIYIDSDVVLLDDIQKLYDEPLDGKILGVIVDQVVSVCEPFKHYTLKALGVPAEVYFNSGVLLMNLDEYRKNDIEGKFLNMLLKSNPETVAPDQDYLNVLCYGSVKYLSAGWDRMPTAEIDYDGDLHLIHYNMFNKPWKYKDVMFEDYFWQYAKKTEYYDYLKNVLETYSDESKKADALGAENLVKNALRIADSGKTFLDAKKELVLND